MVYRYTSIAAFAILAFSFTLLNGLLRPTIDGPPWQFVVLAGLALGAVLTWTGLTYRMRPWLIALMNLVALAVVTFRIAAPDTLVFLLPTGATLGAVQDQLSQAMSLIRTGIEPVIPVSGLVVVVTGVFWAIGAVTAYALLRGRPALAVVPGLVLTLQFATMDRSPTAWLSILVFIALLAGAVLAVTWDERANTAGRMAHASGNRHGRNLLGQATAAALVVTLLGSVLAVSSLRNQVPYDGVVTWRVSTGLTGGFFGSVSYNAFIDIRQSLVEASSAPLFFARITGDADPESVYFRLVTMERYDGGRFHAERPEVEPLETDQWEEAGHAFAGPTATVTTDISISLLAMDWLPAAYTPRGLEADPSLEKWLRVRKDDGAIHLEGGKTYEGLVYSVTSDIPVPDLDVLIGDGQGELSPLFEEADKDQQDVPAPVDGVDRPEPPQVERYLQLPEDLDERIAELAEEQTANLETPFEIGLALEAWFRSSDFRYTTDIEPGHGATDLAEWLLEPDSPFHRAGYCENFATSMAVMARTLGVPSRVVLGFTPGEAVGEAQGDEGEQVVVVRDRNAHAWVELWIPSQGWVRFDPTPRSDRINPTTNGGVAEQLGFDPISYLAAIPAPQFDAQGNPLPDRIDPSQIPDENFEDLELPNFDAASGERPTGLPAWLATILGVLAAAAVLFGGVPLVKMWLRRRRMARLRNGDITAAWEDIVARLEDYGEAPPETLTPAELADAVDPAMRPLATVYGRAVYGPPGGVDDEHVATATKSLEQTSQRLAGRYSARQRLVAWYRPTSLIPVRFRRKRR